MVTDHMNSARPYLLRAFYEWIVDNSKTPYIVVDAEYSGVQVPPDYVKDGKIVFNISPTATDHLNLSNKVVEFEASFGGARMSIYIPMGAVLAVYARENGRGMVFEDEDFPDDDGPTGPEPPPTRPPRKGRPKLKIVKTD